MNIFGLGKTNPFIAKIKAAESKTDKAQVEMRRFSNRLESAMGLTAADIYAADRERITWDTPSFTISTRHCCHNGGWITLLTARPRECNEPGWSNYEFECDNTNWDYEPRGTCTTFFPRPHMQELILGEIRSVMSGISA